MFSRVGWSGGRLSVPGSIRVVRFLTASQKTSGLLLQNCFGFSTQGKVPFPERCVAPFQPVSKASHGRSRNPTNGNRSTPAETQSDVGPVPPLFRQHSRRPELAPGQTNEAVVGVNLQCGWFEDPVPQACERRQFREALAAQDWHRAEIRPIGTAVATAAVIGAR